MSVRNLDTLFNPKSIAVIGASETPGHVGHIVVKNLVDAGFAGPILPVNPKHVRVAGLRCFASVDEIPDAADVAVVCTPPEPVASIISALGARGTKAAVVLTAGPLTAEGTPSPEWQTSLLKASQPSGLRILGPNCIGYAVPGKGVNATFAMHAPKPGSIAFVSQSGALCTAVLDWTRARGIGLSHLISLGNGADIDFGDLLDYLGGSSGVSAILLYAESITSARKFMSAARAAARNKFVIAIKSGRFREGAAAAATHTGALAGADDVYDAALRRAGILRVHEIDELFAAVETLARAKPIFGDRLAILTNGGGPGVLATDALIAGGGRLAQLGGHTIAELNRILPMTWSRTNPVDIIGDAGPDRYRAAMDVLAADRGHDALLVLNVPTALASSYDAACAVADAVKDRSRPVLTNWLGGAEAERARHHFEERGIPTYDSPDRAVAAFLHMVQYRRNQDALMQTPPAAPAELAPDRTRAKELVAAAMERGAAALDEFDAKRLLQAYRVPIVETIAVRDAAEAAAQADRLGYPVALKIRARGVSHKSDVGGVLLDLESREAVLRGAAAILGNVAKNAPKATVDGFTVQRMIRRRGSFELIVGVKTDPVFGPVILFGQGGTAVEVVRDSAVALPPLNILLASELVSRTRVSRMLAGFRDTPPAKLDALYDALVRISQLIIEVPEVSELDINPFLLDADGGAALDARVRLAPPTRMGEARLAIRPYPQDLEETIALSGGEEIVVRPIRPEDELAHGEFARRLEPEDVFFRFFGMVRSFEHSQMARLTQIDYDREMAFIAIGTREGVAGQTLGVVRTVADADNVNAEFAIIVRSDFKGHGLGYALLAKMIRYCAQRGTRAMVGRVRSENRAMLKMAQELGFRRRPFPDPGEAEVELDLDAVRAAAIG